MQRPCLFLILFVQFASLGCAATPQTLFNGKDWEGWEFISTPVVEIGSVCKIAPDGIVSVTGSPAGYLATKTSYKNYSLHAEWRWIKQAGNSGMLVHINPKPDDQTWPPSLQIQMKTKSVGDLLPMTGARFAEALEPNQKIPRHPHIAPDSEKPAGEWNTCDIICRDGTIEVTINGTTQNKVTEASPSSGRIGFQFEGTPFELRNVTLLTAD